MTRVIFLSAVFAMFAVPALAYQSRCVQPYAPTVPNGKSATQAQMTGAHDAVALFIKQSDDYQSCLILELKTERETAARKQKPFDQQIATDINNQANANQREKERVGAEYNGAAHAFNETHLH
jgi:hypothetical protein